jgi:hypothetical protein
VILEPLNDIECLSQLTAIAAEGVAKPEIKELAARFASTDELAAWIRALPQRDDTGDPSDGPRVACDVLQRARLVATDPNCVERAILYLAAAEVLDPAAARQLATVDVGPNLRHTFPVEGGEPVVLDPELRRNALRAGVYALRNGGGDAAELDALDAGQVLTWLLDLAEDEAEEQAGERGLARVERARVAVGRLMRGRAITPRDRADVLYALRLGGDAARLFGGMGAEGYQIARALIARLVVRRTASARRVRNVTMERAVYWGGKALASIYGMGGLYDQAYAEVRRRPGAQPRAPPKAPKVMPAAPASKHEAPRAERPEASPGLVTLEDMSKARGA